MFMISRTHSIQLRRPTKGMCISVKRLGTFEADHKAFSGNQYNLNTNLRKTNVKITQLQRMTGNNNRMKTESNNAIGSLFHNHSFIQSLSLRLSSKMPLYNFRSPKSPATLGSLPEIGTVSREQPKSPAN